MERDVPTGTHHCWTICSTSWSTLIKQCVGAVALVTNMYHNRSIGLSAESGFSARMSDRGKILNVATFMC